MFIHINACKHECIQKLASQGLLYYSCCGKRFATCCSLGNTNKKGFVGAVKMKKKRGSSSNKCYSQIPPGVLSAKHIACALRKHWAAGHDSSQRRGTQVARTLKSQVSTAIHACVGDPLLSLQPFRSSQQRTEEALCSFAMSVALPTWPKQQLKAAATWHCGHRGLTGCTTGIDGHWLRISVSICLTACWESPF